MDCIDHLDLCSRRSNQSMSLCALFVSGALINGRIIEGSRLDAPTAQASVTEFHENDELAIIPVNEESCSMLPEKSSI